MGRGFPSEDFSWLIIDDAGDVCQHILCYGPVIGLWQPLSDAPVGVFDGAFLPRAVGVAEVSFAWQGLMLCELQAVVEGDGFWLEWRDSVAQFLGDAGGSFAIRIIDDEQEARFALDGGDEIVFLFFKVHEVGLPVVIMIAVVDVAGSLVNRDPALYFAA